MVESATFGVNLDIDIRAGLAGGVTQDERVGTAVFGIDIEDVESGKAEIIGRYIAMGFHKWLVVEEPFVLKRKQVWMDKNPLG